MKTIFIPIFFGHVARNILRTDVLPELLRQARVVVFMPLSKAELYRREFRHPNLILEAVNFHTNNQWADFFNKTSFLFVDSATNFIKQSMAAKKRRFKLLVKFGLIRFLSGSKPLMRIYHCFFSLLMRDNFFGPYFEKYKPDLVFCPHIFGKEDLAVLREAKRRGVKTVAVVNSWDNLSTRGMMRQIPDKLIVHNDYVKEEALRWSELQEKSVSVAGMPHFDYYLNYRPSAKEVFCESVGLDAKKRFLLFCPPVNSLKWSWQKLAADLKNQIITGGLPDDLRILVRFAPTDDEDMSKYDLNDAIIKYDKPGHYFNPEANGDVMPERKDWEFTKADMEHFADSLYYCSMLINYGSTLNIDGAAFDKPLINAVFDDRPEKGREFVEWVYVKDHNKKLFSTNGASLVYDFKELLKEIKEYLKNPAFKSDGRRAMIKQQCWQFDGLAGQRMAAQVLANLPKIS